MSKTTITINGKECIVLPVPKGAFISGRCMFLEFVLAVAIDINQLQENVCEYGYLEAEAYPLYYNMENGFVAYDQNYYLQIYVTDTHLEELVESDNLTNDYESRNNIISLYHDFVSNGTHLTTSAISWFKKMFKK